MDRGAWRATVHGVTKSWTQLGDLTLRADSQCCDSFRWTVEGLSHTNTCIHSPPNSPPIQAATEYCHCLLLAGPQGAEEQETCGSFTSSHTEHGVMKGSWAPWSQNSHPGTVHTSQVKFSTASCLSYYTVMVIRADVCTEHVHNNRANCISSQWSSQSLVGQAWFWLLTSPTERLGVFSGTHSQSQGCQVVDSSV